MIKIGLQDLENIFQNTKIRFNKEQKKSEDKYLDILLDEIQKYFDHLNTFEFDNKVFITQDKILSLKKYLYTLNTFSNNINLIYKKSDAIITEINKLVNINVFERDTILNKLDRIHNFVMSHTISSEQNAEFAIFYRENFNDGSIEDKKAGSKGVEIDTCAGVLKLKSEKVSKNVIDTKSVKLSLKNKEDVDGKIFNNKELFVGDLYGIDEIYDGKSEQELRNYLLEDELGDNQIAACPFEIVYTNPLDMNVIKSKIREEDDTNYGKIIINDSSFLDVSINTLKLQETHIPEIILEFSLSKPTLCSFVDIKFDNDIPSLIKEKGYVKGAAYDDKKTYKIINFDSKDNKINFPFYRLYWGKLISLERLQVSFKAPWKETPIYLEKWVSNLVGYQNINITKVFYTEGFDHKHYNRATGLKLTDDSLLKNIQTSQRLE